MLILSRKVGEQIVVPHIDLAVKLVGIKGNVVRLGISAPEHVAVYREELWQQAGQETDGCDCRNVLPLVPGSSGTGRIERRAATARSVADTGHFDDLAAELTRAAYHVALQHGRAGTWLDLELELWRALSDVVKIARARRPKTASSNTTPGKPRQKQPSR
jgi:carbon storage regulator